MINGQNDDYGFYFDSTETSIIKLADSGYFIREYFSSTNCKADEAVRKVFQERPKEHRVTLKIIFRI